MYTPIYDNSTSELAQKAAQKVFFGIEDDNIEITCRECGRDGRIAVWYMTDSRGGPWGVARREFCICQLERTS